MLTTRRIFGASALGCILVAFGCKELGVTDPDIPELQYTESIMVNARWLDNATGLPTEARSTVPTNLAASYCPSTSVLLYNHKSPIPSWATFGGLIVYNNCTLSADYLVCATAGGTQSNGIPQCNTDPRTTPISRLYLASVGRSGFDYVGNTGLDLQVNVFYCPSGKPFTMGLIAGSRVTDCMK